jgi:hypothetical protein
VALSKGVSVFLLDQQRYRLRLYIPDDPDPKYIPRQDFHTAPSAAHPGVHRTFDDLEPPFTGHE